jgi:type II secretory pathway predicted ATPase ExeA
MSENSENFPFLCEPRTSSPSAQVLPSLAPIFAGGISSDKGVEAGVDWSHFEMARAPFRSTVDTGSYFPSATHEAALRTLSGGLARRDSIVLLDGPAGSGKSFVARLWLERLPNETARVVLPNLQRPCPPADLLQAILFDLNLPYSGMREQELRLAVTDHLLGQAAKNAATALIVDEAQNLGPAALEELRLLGNIESPGGSGLFVVLVAQPSIQDVLKQAECAGFAQRIGSKSRLEPFTLAESTAYLRHQIKLGGREPDEVIDNDAVTLLAGSGQGVARYLNRAATLAAELAAEAGAELIDVEAAMEAIARLDLVHHEASEEPNVLKHPGKVKKPRIARKKSA